MPKPENNHEISSIPTESDGSGGYGLGIYKPGSQYKEKALEFFQQCVGKEVYERAMSSEVGKRHYYVAVRTFLSQTDWEKFVWIEEHGSLAGFPD